MKRQVLLLATLLFGNALLYAYEDSYCLPKSTFLSKPASANEPRVEAYTAPARIDVRRSCGFYFWGSYLYWQPKQEGMEVGFFQTINAMAFTSNNSLLNLDWPYKSGFKAGAGLHTSLDNWDMAAEYTWFHTIHKHTFKQNPIFTKWFDLDSTVGDNEFSSLEANWKLHLDMGDVELTRDCFMGTNFTLRPHLGGRILWIEQRYTQSGPNLSAGTNLSMITSSRSWGVGPRAGVEANFIFGGRNLRFFGNADIALLYNHFHANYQSDTISGVPGGATTFVSVNRTSRVMPNADLGAGFALGFYAGHHNFHIDFAASYDFQVFWNQNMMAELAFNNNEPGIGNLYIQGLTGTLRIDF